MTKKKAKFSKMIMLVLTMTFVCSNLVYAAVAQSGNDTKFTKHFIESNSMTTVASGTKKTAGQTLNMMVTYMYDGDGIEKTSWQRTRWKIYDGNGYSYSNEIVVIKGQYTGIALNSKVSTDFKLTAKAKGNDPALDAKISGYLYNFVKK